MKRLLLGSLLVATALAPLVAQAQEQRLERAEDMDIGDRAQRVRDSLTREERQERRAERAERQAERAERQAERAESRASAERPRREDRPSRPDRRLDGDGERRARPDGLFRRLEGQVFPPVRERREDRSGRREERLERLEDRRERREARRDDRRDRREWRDDRRDRDRDRDSGWTDWSWGRDAYGGGRVWNRGWRDDPRYDWNRYREYNQDLYRLPRYYAPYGYGYEYRRFGLGATLPRSLFAPGYWIDDPWTYRLPHAYGPYRWVRHYGDALLVDLRTGRVVDMVHGIFY